MNAITTQDIDRIKTCLAYIAADRGSCPPAWIAEVIAEAKAAGLTVPPKYRSDFIGTNCRPGIDSQITYGGDYEDVF